MAIDDQQQRARRLELVEQVDLLNDEVKTLALNLAIHMAKIRSNGLSEELEQMEPKFVRLVNGAVKAVKDLAIVLDAARNREVMAYDVPGNQKTEDQIECGLRSILPQCTEIMDNLNQPHESSAGESKS